MKRTILLSLLVTIIVAGMILPAGCKRGFSHQPSTINQMKMLVTPGDTAVEQALQESLGNANTTSTDDASSGVTDINKMRLWVYSNIKQASDETLHGVSDYWQTPDETLTLRAGDCEDFAILMVSMMRAYGVPKDQVYVAVGYDANKDWHAFVLERYSYGAWVEFDPQNVDDAVLLGGNMALPYDISYCFNGQSGFNGTPGYPPGYTVPPVSIVPVKTLPKLIYISDVNAKNQDLDAAKQRLGELWLPTYMPKDYIFTDGYTYSSPGRCSLMLTYLAGIERQLIIGETNAIAALDTALFQAGTVQQITINNQPATFGIITYHTGTDSSSTVISALVLDFIQGNLGIRFIVTPTDSLTHEELIKIAESFVKY